MNSQQIAKRAALMMRATGIVGGVALLGAVYLMASQRQGYAMIWMAVGIVNVVLYAINLRIYRSFDT